MSDREQIERQVVGVVHHIDRKRWVELRALFADEVTTDYVSLFGGSVQQQAGDALIETWKSVLARVVTQHLLGPIDVEISGDRATASCHVRAMHYAAAAKSGSEWEVLGHYRFQLLRTPVGFRITGMTLETFHQTGNKNLLQEAQ